MRKKREAESISIPMSAMIDVVFLLLVFFLVTYQDDIIESHVSVNMPSPSTAARSQNSSHLLEIHVYPGQYLLMGDQPVTMSQLTDTLSTYSKYDSEQTLLIKVSGKAKHKELITLLDNCKRVGFANLNIMMIREQL